MRRTRLATAYGKAFILAGARIKAANAPINAGFLHDDSRGGEPLACASRYLGMEHTRFGDLHALLKLAGQLRASAAETTDHIYIHLFLRTACALEARADRLAFPDHTLSGRGEPVVAYH